eukprot:5700778-Amphidinium_carterae.1
MDDNVVSQNIRKGMLVALMGQELQKHSCRYNEMTSVAGALCVKLRTLEPKDWGAEMRVFRVDGSNQLDDYCKARLCCQEIQAACQ